jgi:hypothetical protein
VTLAELAALLAPGASHARPVLYCHPEDLDRTRWAAGQLPPAWQATAQAWTGTVPGAVVVAWWPVRTDVRVPRTLP